MLVNASNIQGAYSKIETPTCHFQYNKPSRKQMNKAENINPRTGEEKKERRKKDNHLKQPPTHLLTQKAGDSTVTVYWGKVK